MTRFDDIDRLQGEIDQLRRKMKHLVRATLMLRPADGRKAAGPYLKALREYEAAQAQLVDRENTLRRMLGEEPLAQ